VLVEADPDFFLPDPHAAAAELGSFRVAGGGAVVDMMPTAPGRNASLLAEVSSRTGVHIVSATGFVPWALSPEAPARMQPEEELASWMAAEILEGIEARNHSGGTIQRLPVRAGVIKIALGHGEPAEVESRFIRASARAHLLTGAPITVHTECGAWAMELLELLDGLGVEPRAAMIAHVSQSARFELLESIASSGAFLIMDGAGKPQYSEEMLIDQLRRLVDGGFLGNILLGLDFSRRKYWKSYGGGPGFEYLTAGFVARLASAGFAEHAIRDMLAGNPGRALALRAAS
jgi:phosphotriesterase-related protein